ncbi:MAG TPA: TrkA C-terminal domain-containing protein [Thermoanaerobaculia bacterium]|nr:TrkA C-terminal domain-containing protein [Thermoanaerobaculia bacterium]
MRELIEILNTIPLAGLMLVVAAGFLIGRLEWRGLSPGPAGGTLLVALLLGALGLSWDRLYGAVEPPVTLGDFGFALFIYSVGFEAGPRLFAAVESGRAWRFAAVAAAVNGGALAIALLLGRLLDLGAGATAGLLAGALTSAPAYAVASEAGAPAGPLSVAFVLSYPIGLFSVTLLVQFLPRWMGDTLYHGAEAQEEEERRPRGPELSRVFVVERDDAVGRSLAELQLTARTGCVLTWLHRGSEFLVPAAHTVLERNDRVMARGRLDELRELERRVGGEVFDDELRDAMASPRAIQVTRRDAIGRTLAQLQLTDRFRCLVTEVHRGGVSLEPAADLRLQRDDVVLVSGRRDDVRAASAALGRFERTGRETDLAVYAGGILLGLLIGAVPLPFLGESAAVGTAVGLLTMGVLLGRFRHLGPVSAHVPPAARQLVRDLGILLFVAETGVRAGNGPLMGGQSGVVFGTVFAGAALVTSITVLSSVFAARRLLGLQPLDAWGSVCGGLTSSAALVALRRASDSNEPAISYAAAYAVGSVLATLAGRFVVALL